MTRRKGHLFPRQVSDIGAFIFVCVMIPVTYMYETGLVLRHLYYRDAYTTYILHMVMGVFLLFNLLGNFIGLWLTDTSTRFVVLPSVIKVILLEPLHLPTLLQSDFCQIYLAGVLIDDSLEGSPLMCSTPI